MTATTTPAAGSPAPYSWVQSVSAGFLAPTSYTPTITQSGSVAKTVTYCEYIVRGGVVDYWGTVSFTGSGTATNLVTVSLPVNADSGAVTAGQNVGTGILYDASAGDYPCIARIASASTISFVQSSIEGTSNNKLGLNGGFTAQIVSGDALQWHVTYAIA